MPSRSPTAAPLDDILIVDDDVSSLGLLAQVLSAAGYRVRPTTDPRLAIESALRAPPRLIMLDIRMPGMDGFEVCRRLKQDPLTRDIPVIFLSALQAAEEKVLGFQRGGVDYIVKPFQDEEVLARVNTHTQLRRMQLNLEAEVERRTAEVCSREERLRESELKFQAIFEQAAVGLAQLTPEGRFIRINQEFCDMLGYRPDEMVSRDFQELTHVEDREPGSKNVERLLRGEADTFTMEKRYIRKDGTRIWAVLTVTLVRHDDGRPQWFIAAAKDTTLSKKLQQDRDRILEVNPGMITVTDWNMKLTYVNPAWEQVLGCPQAELTGQCFLDLVHPDDREMTEEQARRLIEGNMTVSFENRHIHQDGSIRHIAWVANPLADEKLVYAIGHDVTMRKLAEEKLDAYRNRLRKLASELIIAEERERNLIAVELHDGVAQSLALARLRLLDVVEDVSGTNAEEPLADASRIVRESLQQIREVLLELGSPSLRNLGLSGAISDWLHHQIAPQHHLRVMFRDASADVALDHSLRVLLFRNTRELVANVVKHSRSESLTVRVDNSRQDFRITVEDKGVGFEEDPSSSEWGGASFGLFSIRERMADVGGFLEIDSAPGKGCRATLVVPHREESGSKSDS